MKSIIFRTATLMAILLFGCSAEEENGFPTPSNNTSGTWLIPKDKILDGGPGKDGIPAISNPSFANAFTVGYLNEDDLVIGFKHDDEIRAYPHKILDWHEIVNDQINNTAFAVTYCPLTGSAVNWDRTINGVTTTFGVSGLLYNSNLIPYDRETDSNWSQMKLKCVNGALFDLEAITYPLVETTWKTWKEKYPDSEVMTLETGFSRDYQTYPYINGNGDYRKEDYLIFPTDNTDNRLDAKERVHGVIVNEDVKVYRFEEFENQINIVEDNVGGRNIAVIGSKQDNFIISFFIDNEVLKVSNSGESIVEDQNENQYNIFGEIISGPDQGKRLTSTQSFMAYWFSWAAFYPQVEIYALPEIASPDDWLIPKEKVIDGGPGKDGIPAISNPNFDAVAEVDFLHDDDLVVGFKNGDEIRAYPHRILDWHEIVNDHNGYNFFSLTYCPLTGTASVWERTINTSFGVSGLLYNSNLIPYDRETDSYWSQMQLRSVNGELIGTQATVLPSFETTWKTWKEMYPYSEVLNKETGINRNYENYPYVNGNGDYRVEDYLLFPVENRDERLAPKERVLGVIEGNKVKAYRFDDFKNGITIIEDVIGNQKIVVVGSKDYNYMVSFKIGDQSLTVENSNASIFKDQNDNQYNIFGEIISGPDTGEKLESTKSFIGYWFAWVAFYPDLDLYSGD